MELIRAKNPSIRAQSRTPLRLLLVEDHAILREGLRALLSTESDIDIVAESGDGGSAIKAAQEHQPDVVLMDLSLPRLNGVDAIRHIHNRDPGIRILALTVHKSEEYIRAALAAGASGYILKDSNRSELLMAIRSIAKGHSFLSPEMSRKVVSGYLNGFDGPQNEKTTTSWDTLTNRERQILKMVAEGYRNKDIAKYLFISVKTVEKHRANMMKKLNLRNVPALTAYCVERGLIDSALMYER